ncbi:MAG: hypothetical protein GY804_05025 [Alphaproteobacteria bacterium]|nr:hypothetical protein [Alphaproteobacteria bacterium]
MRFTKLHYFTIIFSLALISNTALAGQPIPLFGNEYKNQIAQVSMREKNSFEEIDIFNEDEDDEYEYYYVDENGTEHAVTKDEYYKDAEVEIEIEDISNNQTPKYNTNIKLPTPINSIKIRTGTNQSSTETEAEKFKRLFEANKAKNLAAKKAATIEKTQNRIRKRIKRESSSKQNAFHNPRKANHKKKNLKLTGSFEIKPISSVNYKSLTGLNQCFFKYKLTNKTNTKLFKTDILIKWAEGMELRLRYYKNNPGNEETTSLAVSGPPCNVNTNILPDIEIKTCQAKGIDSETCKKAINIEWRPAAYER